MKAIAFMKKDQIQLPWGFVGGPYFAACFLVGFSWWLTSSFDAPTIDQILYHLHYSEGLGIKVGGIFVLTFIVECIVFPLVFAALAFLIHCIALAWTIDTDKRLLRWSLHKVFPLLAVIIGFASLLYQLSAFSWISAHFAEDRFSPHFVDARPVTLHPVSPRNLILIYVESLEESYGNPVLWDGRDLLKPLRDLGGSSFGNLQQSPGATWTIAAMVASQCGVPLRVVSHYDFKVKATDGRTFLPRATCLGTLLKERGYQNVFLGGAPLSFAGKGKFLQDHGYDIAYGREEWQKEGATPEAFNEWGLYDDALFAKAKVELSRLHASGQPFNLTLLTLDLHNPIGFRSPTCRGHGINGFEDIVECTTRQIADFVHFARHSGYLENTNIAILGDHLAVANPLIEKLQTVQERRIFNLFITEQSFLRNRADLVIFDLFPTFIEFAGFSVAGGRLGLGYSAFSPPQSIPPKERLIDLMQTSLTYSKTYRQLWSPP